MEIQKNENEKKQRTTGMGWQRNARFKKCTWKLRGNAGDGVYSKIF